MQLLPMGHEEDVPCRSDAVRNCLWSNVQNLVHCAKRCANLASLTAPFCPGDVVPADVELGDDDCSEVWEGALHQALAAQCGGQLGCCWNSICSSVVYLAAPDLAWK